MSIDFSNLNDDFDFGKNTSTQIETKQKDTGLADCYPIFLRDLDMNVPPIEWVYGTTLVRGMLTVFGGIGGTGKTSFVIKVLLSIALGRSLLAFDPDEPEHAIYEPGGTVWYYSLEDPQDMLVRKVKAEMLHHKLNPRTVWDKIALRSGRDAPLIVARVINGDVVREDVQPIIDFIVQNRIVVMGVDPFANSFEGADAENQSGIMKIILDQWRIIAHKANCAIWLIHHFKKGGLAGDADAFRGSSAIENAARVMETMTTMTIEQAAALGVEDSERRHHVRLDNAKVNLSAAPGEAQWFKFVGVPLGNRTPKYPKGDIIGVLTRWQPTEKVLTWQQAETILNRLEEGDPNGMFFTPAAQGSYWAGAVIMAVADFTKAQAAVMLKEWITSHLLTEGDYTSPKTKKPAKKLEVNPLLRTMYIKQLAAQQG